MKSQRSYNFKHKLIFVFKAKVLQNIAVLITSVFTRPTRR